MSKTAIVYHSDVDGHLSGAILQKWLRDINQPKPTMVQMNYDDVFPWSLVDSDTEVYMADFGLQPWSEMVSLSKMCKKLVWIDHHKSAIQSYDEWVETDGTPLEGIRQDGKAACRLCWEYCYPDKPEPLPVYLAGKYDVWEWQDVEDSIEYQYGTKFYETDPGTEEGRKFWDEQLDFPKETPFPVIKVGKLLMDYKARSNKSYIKENSFVTTLEGLTVIATNKKGSSQMFDSVFDPAKHDAMLTFAWAKGMWTISLYTDKPGIDVGSVAKKLGGGGHIGAAGFQATELPFELK